jgi:phage tail sheath protein FI
MLEYVDRPLDRENADDIIGTISAYMRQLIGLGAIFGGRAWLDEELNTAEAWRRVCCTSTMTLVRNRRLSLSACASG